MESKENYQLLKKNYRESCLMCWRRAEIGAMKIFWGRLMS